MLVCSAGSAKEIFGYPNMHDLKYIGHILEPQGVIRKAAEMGKYITASR